MLSKKLGVFIPLPCTFNVKNSVHLINDLLEIPFDQDLKFASFDITNMYSNIPKTNLINATELMCDQHGINIEEKTEIMKISQILIEQNYFQFQDKLYIQKEELAMSA
jgi:hypothetical protein